MGHVLTVPMIHIVTVLRVFSVSVTMVTQARVGRVKVIRWSNHTLRIFTQMLLNTDIDECQDNSTCAYRENTVCVNTNGSYDCACEEGYITCDYSYDCTRKLTRVYRVHTLSNG